MAKTYNRLEIDVNKKPTDIITAVQADSNSRYLDVSLFNNGVPLDLTGHEVKIFMAKPEESGEIWNDGVITNAKEGRCEFLMTTEALARMGHLQAQISIWKDNTEILSTQVFEINVTKTLLGNSSVESSNEYGTLVVLFQNLYEAYDLMVDMVSSFGKKGAVADARNIVTFWQGVEYLAKYMDTDLKGLLEKAIANSSVQGVLDLIGTSGDSGNTTVMGKENKMLNALSNMIPLYRADDYLEYEYIDTFIILNNSEISSTKSAEKTLGIFQPPEGCVKVVLTANIKGYYGSVYLGGLHGMYNVSASISSSKDLTEYQELTKEIEFADTLPSSVKITFTGGTSGTAYCNNVTIKAYRLKRVVTTELHQANTIKNYGSVASGYYKFKQCPRLDRVFTSTGDNGETFEVDHIPYVRNVAVNKDFKVFY